MEDDTVVSLKLPGEIDDPLSEVLRDGARSLLMQAVEAEVSVFFGKLSMRVESGEVWGQQLAII